MHRVWSLFACLLLARDMFYPETTNEGFLVKMFMFITVQLLALILYKIRKPQRRN